MADRKSDDIDYYDAEGNVAPSRELLSRFARAGISPLLAARPVSGEGGAWSPRKPKTEKQVEALYREEAQRCWSHQPHKDTFWEAKFAQKRVSLWDEEEEDENDGPFDTRGGPQEP